MGRALELPMELPMGVHYHIDVKGTIDGDGARLPISPGEWARVSLKDKIPRRLSGFVIVSI
jgi:hypothetical protein